MIATITLNPSIDQHIHVRRLVKEDANRATAVSWYAGGKGLNVSKAATEIGVRTAAYAPVGGFSGRLWTELAGRLRIPVRTMPLSGDTRINTILTDLHDHAQTRVSAPGPQFGAHPCASFLKLLMRARPRPAYWVMAGGLPQGAPPDTYKTYIRALQGTGAPCALDADGDALRLGVQAAPFLIKPNEHEIQRLMGIRIRTVSGYLKAARVLTQKGVRVVVVSLAAKGALFVTAQEAYHVPGLRVQARNKVGAGDALLGGLLSGLVQGKTLLEAAKFSIAVSASAVMRDVPRLLDKRDLPRLIRNVRVRVLE